MYINWRVRINFVIWVQRSFLQRAGTKTELTRTKLSNRLLVWISAAVFHVSFRSGSAGVRLYLKDYSPSCSRLSFYLTAWAPTCPPPCEFRTSDMFLVTASGSCWSTNSSSASCWKKQRLLFLHFYLNTTSNMWIRPTWSWWRWISSLLMKPG